jgi:hypothetical protein
MDAFSFVSEAVTDSLATALERRGNLRGLFPRDPRRVAQQGVSVTVRLDCERESRVLYGFTIGWDSKPARHFVKQETLRCGRAMSFERDEKSFKPETVSLRPAMDAETLVFPLIAGSNDTWKSITDSLRLISAHQFSPQAIRSEPKIGGEERLSRDGHNAGDVLKHLKLKDKEWIEHYLSEVVPGIREVRIKTVAGRRVIGFAQDYVQELSLPACLIGQRHRSRRTTSSMLWLPKGNTRLGSWRPFLSKPSPMPMNINQCPDGECGDDGALRSVALSRRVP